MNGLCFDQMIIIQDEDNFLGNGSQIVDQGDQNGVGRWRLRGLEHAQCPLAVVSVAYLKGQKDIPGQLLKLEDEMGNLGLTYPGGLDPTEKREFFKTYNVNVGSATLVILDPLGRVAYYEQDPRPNAFGLFGKVFERLLSGGE